MNWRHSRSYLRLPYNPALKERARELRKNGILCEVLLWNQLKNRKFYGYDFDRQKIIGNYIVDFFCLDCRVVIEVDGSSHDDKWEYDTKRHSFLESLGLTVIHVPAVDVLQTLDGVMERLRNHPAFQNGI
jgi:very-short-patch-repair endonuclease